MKEVKKEIIKIIILLLLQILVSFSISLFSKTTWNIFDLIGNYGFAVFWISYIILIISIHIISKKFK